MDNLETLKQQEHKLRMSKDTTKEELDAVVKQIKQQTDNFNQLLKDEEMGFEESDR